MIKLRTWTWGDDLGFPRWGAPNNHKVAYKREQEGEKQEEEM